MRRRNDKEKPCDSASVLTTPVMMMSPSTQFSFNRQYPLKPYPMCLITISITKNARNIISNTVLAVVNPDACS